MVVVGGGGGGGGGGGRGGGGCIGSNIFHGGPESESSCKTVKSNRRTLPDGLILTGYSPRYTLDFNPFTCHGDA